MIVVVMEWLNGWSESGVWEEGVKWMQEGRGGGEK